MTNARHGGGRRPGQAGRACTQDSADASLVPEQRQPRPGTSADLLADPGPDGQARRRWLAQKVTTWRARPPRYFTNPRPAPIGGPRRIPPSLACDRAEVVPAVDVAELVACGPGR